MTRSQRGSSPDAISATASGASRWPLGAVFAALLSVLLVIYWPSLGGAMLWDDGGHVTSPALQSWSGLVRIWFEPGATQQYYPLLHSAFWVEHGLWGDATVGYRLVNLLWHALSACLFIALLRRLAVPGALLAGLLFALHPVCVESVAWIAEQKNTLSTVFYLAAALAWLRFEEDRRPQRYVVAMLWFIAALLTKSVTATLPAALLVLAWWRRGRISWRDDVQPLLPWFVVGAGLGAFTAWFEQTGIGAQGADFSLGLVERVLLAGHVLWFYVGKLVWPANLAFFYPRWHVDATDAAQYVFLVAALALLAGLVWWVRRGGSRGPLAAALLFGGTLFPVLGFVNVYPFVFSYVADHFQYLASLAVFALAGAGFVQVREIGRPGWMSSAAPWLATVVVALLGVLTWQQSKDYVNSITLYRATLARNPDSWIAHHNLATELAARGAVADALPHAQRALELKPDLPEALNNVADDLTRLGRGDEALPLVQRALKLQPRYAQAENTLGAVLMTLGRRDEALAHFKRAIELQPALAEAHFNLGLAEADHGDFAAAITQFKETLSLRPDHVDAEVKLGMALALTGQLPEARGHFERALALSPDSAALHQTYGRTLLTSGQLDDAERELNEALRLNPALPGVHRDLAIVLQRLGRTEQARAHALEATRGP